MRSSSRLEVRTADRPARMRGVSTLNGTTCCGVVCSKSDAETKVFPFSVRNAKYEVINCVYASLHFDKAEEKSRKSISVMILRLFLLDDFQPSGHREPQI